jgi:hypothetical protein
MSYQAKDMSGTLFKNDRREKDSHPHATGTALIDGVEYWVSAWTKDGAKGKFQSLSFKRKEPRQDAPSKPTNQTYGQASGGNASPRELDDTIPF